MFPYTVVIAHPDYKRPYSSVEHGLADSLENAKERICNSFLDAMNSYDQYEWIECDDHEKLSDAWYSDSYMEQPVFDYSVFDIEKRMWEMPWKIEDIYAEIFKRYIADTKDDSGDEDYCKEHNRILADMRKKYEITESCADE